MSLKDWADNGWLKPYKTDKQEIANLFTIVERDLSDANLQSLSLDWKFGIAYNAALKLCTIVLLAHGYRPDNALAHYRTIMSLKEISEQKWRLYSSYINECRMRRNTLEYDEAYIISQEDVQKLIDFTTQFQKEVKLYMESNYPDML